MKKALALLAALVLIASAAAAEVDLSGMSFDELVELAHQVDQAIWASDGWQEVTVPPGTYKVGEDIPAGKWTLSVTEAGELHAYYCEAINEAGDPITYPNPYKAEYMYGPKNWMNHDGQQPTQVTFDCKPGYYIVIQEGNAIFTPSTGKSSLGFK